MKKFGILFASALALLALAACSDDEDEINKEENYDDSYYAAQATVSSSDANFTASSDGGTINFKTEGGTVTLNVSCGCDWTADNEAADLFTTSVTSTTLTVTAGQNTVEEELTGTVIVKTSNEGIVFATITITQSAYGAPEISISTNEWNAPAKGTLTTEIAVEASADWTAESADSWLTVTKTDTGISLTAYENGETTERSTKVTLTCTDNVSTVYDYVTVNQDPLAYITLSAESLSFEASASSSDVEVTSNYDWECSYDTNNGWFTVTSNGNTLTVSVEANETAEDREGVVTISAGDEAENVAEVLLTATQTGSYPMILTYTITAANTTTQIPIYGTVDCTVDWGDGGEVQTVTSNRPSHTYAEAGEYDITIDGTVTALYSIGISSNISGLPITAVKSWGKTGLTDMQYAFYYCKDLVSLPETTKGALANAISFYDAFHYCSSLEKIPADLFEGCSVATDFGWCFYNCAIKEVPSGLFKDCASAENFDYTFYACPFTTIPEGLFDKCTEVTSFYEAFYRCANLTTVPETLFAKCTEVTNFEYVFYNCTSLTSIPTGIFSNNKKVTDFRYAFSGDTALTGESPYDMVDGNKVHLYERDNYPDIYESPKSTSCFKNCTGLTDYDSIPSGWK